MLKQIKPLGAVEAVTKQIMDLIKSGYFKPHEKLPGEMELMEMMNVGRSTIREAKRILSSMNLIESRAGKGCIVKEVSVDSIFNEDMLEMLIRDEEEMLHESRILIESQIAMLALQRATEADLAKMQQCVELLKRAITIGGDVYEPGTAFHKALSEASYNRVMIKIHDLLSSTLVKLQKPGYEQKYDPDKEIQVHQDLVDALKARNKEMLMEALDRHFEYVREISEKR
ncbi:hypothetical protein SY83_13440 [Paenibacillus swuensis]|uniref:HTH gntR-type domain-containing protein n=1 Tax=Paenibacillus swuensis TaxID=1178515 RepID=A0A172TJT3_9BACL|nr:FadR/GntR family transcriptional regulator [Paenibacillus swuensis]ANE47097.1 hypothetical protein SY83_13440 [Paenibacillus swuensis]